MGPQERGKTSTKEPERIPRNSRYHLYNSRISGWFLAVVAGSPFTGFLTRCHWREVTASCWRPEAHTRSAITLRRARSFCGVAPRDRSQVIEYGGGGAPTTIISGWFQFDQISIKILRRLLPLLILVRGDQAQSLTLHTTLNILASETAHQAPGSGLVVNRLADVLFSLVAGIDARPRCAADYSNRISVRPIVYSSGLRRRQHFFKAFPAG
jgi:hypothetical protein